MVSNSVDNAVANAIPGLALTTTQVTSPLTPPKSPAATSTAASAVPSQSQVKQRKTAKNAVQNWQPPDLGNIGCCIISTYGRILMDESLVSLALDLLKMEDWMVSTIAQQLRLALSTRTDSESKARSEQELASLSVIKVQIRQIQRSEAKIHENYLTDEYLVRYWEEASDVVDRIMFWDPKDAPNYKSTIARLTGLEDLAGELARSMLMAAQRGLLTSDIRYAISQKWRIYDQMIDAFHKEAGTFRTSMKWSTVTHGLFGDENVGKKLSARRRAKKQVIATLWINFAVLTVASICFLGVGCFYSSGAPGRWRDPDFWFLLQSSIVQLCGLFITGLSFDKASIKDWASGGAATVFAIIAPVLYLKVPSQYSMLSSAVGGVFQALLIQQRSVCDLMDGT